MAAASIPTNKQEIARELEPCPFCGAAAELKDYGRDRICVQCSNVDCRAHSMLSLPGEDAIARWNSRALYRSTVTGGDPEHCHRCGAHNPCWHAPSPLWNAIMRGGSIDGDPIFGDMVCATCFTALAEERGLASIWRLTADVVNVPLETVTPSGRVWDDRQGLWIDQSPPPTTQAIEAAAIERAAIEEIARIIRIRCRLVTGEEYEMAREAAKEITAAIRALTPSPDAGDEIVRSIAAALLGESEYEPTIFIQESEAERLARAALSAISGDR